MNFQIAAAHGESIETAVSSILSANAETTGFPYAPEPLKLKIVESGKLIAGLVGFTLWDWLYIQTLAVEADFRGQGLGRQLVLEAERIARQRKCHAAWVDTFTFQAPEFYTRLGYAPFGTLPDFPAGQQRIFLWKDLIPAETETMPDHS
ncbi:acetyltransferase [Gimesia panareensis]|uniref:Acetyltransferase n=1 Tax=Gimesia panareensis TaxID=2527978 RepID=A0A518FXI0_9PLAN|nr:GNAT family N-acetyltransferase [Gimesia panareensis]QDV20966.1 acetyltransferase [Gimesia panareensis]